MDDWRERFSRHPLRSDPVEGETHARVLDHQPEAGGGLILAVTEGRLELVKLRAKPAPGSLSVGEHIYVGPEEPKRTHVAAVIGGMRWRDLSARAQAEAGLVIAGIVRDAPAIFLGFYNRAGNLSLKMHAFQLLKGVGAAKAQEMVRAREQHGRAGWPDLATLDEDCGVDSAMLLGERFAKELENPESQPRLLDLLLRTEEH